MQTEEKKVKWKKRERERRVMVGEEATHHMVRDWGEGGGV